MTEKDLWKKIDAAMGNLWHAQRHEDEYSPDIPDVSYTYQGTSGWIELKCSSPSGRRPVRIPKLRSGQLNWMTDRAWHGGNCHILWAAGPHLLLIPATHVGEFDESRDMGVWQLRACWNGTTEARDIQAMVEAAARWDRMRGTKPR